MRDFEKQVDIIYLATFVLLLSKLKKMSIATENFLKTIYHLNHQSEEDCKTGNVARKLGVTSAAATDMAKKLANKNLLIYKKYQEMKLTKEGGVLALKVIRKHRLWETFLHQTFKMSMHEIHKEAEGLEHQTSDFLADKINEYLNFPKFDPHGDPIPGADGSMAKDLLSIVLYKGKIGSRYKIVRLVSDEKEFFDFCSNNSIENGAEISILNQYEKATLTEVKIANKTLILPSTFTQNIYLHEIK
ncbi:MAG: DtxR family Mn-dependent transcriptional regulator [Patiriisocius sp.]|jgi:DtxR family Mn-dependent transcriptional regulator